MQQLTEFPKIREQLELSVVVVGGVGVAVVVLFLPSVACVQVLYE